MVIPITGDIQPNNPIRPRRSSHTKEDDENRFEELLIDQVDAAGEGEQGGEDRKAYWEKKNKPDHGKPQVDHQAAGRESLSEEAEGSDSLRGGKIDLRA